MATESDPVAVDRSHADASTGSPFARLGAHPRRQAAVLVGIGLLPLFGWVALVERPQIERILERRVETVLQLDGHRAISVEASGRDLSLRGNVRESGARERIALLARSRPGVRTVDVSGVVVGDAASATSDSDAAAGTDDSTGGSGAAAAVDGSEAVTGSNAAETTAPLPVMKALLEATISGRSIEVRGTAPTQDALDIVLARSVAALGAERVRSKLEVGVAAAEAPDTNDYRRVGQFLAILSQLPGAELAFQYDRGTLQLNGSVADSATLALLQGEAANLVPDPSLRSVTVVTGQPATTALAPITTSTTSTVA